jgi:ribosomal protein S21
MTQQPPSQSRVRIEDLLETVADAVSALVVFSQEAHENKRTMTNLQTGAKSVKAATDYLTQSADYTISTWRKVGSPEMAEKMVEACKAINQAAQQILDAANELMQDPLRQVAKQSILDAGKNIMKAMVRLLQFNDIYEIVMILRQIEIIRKREAELNDPLFPVEEFGQLLRQLSKMLDKRVVVVHDTKVKNMMQQASGELERFIVPFKENLRSALTDAKTKEQRQTLVAALNETLKKAEEATKLSAKSPFNLSLLDAQWEDVQEEEEDVIASQKGLQDEIEALKKAVAAGDENEVDRAIRGLKRELDDQLDAAEETAKKVADPKLRARLLASVDALRNRLNQMLDRMSAAAREAVKSKEPSMLEPLIRDLLQASSALLEGPARDKMLQHAANLEDLLENLQQAAARGKRQEAVKLAKDARAEMQDAAKLAKILAQSVTDDPFRKNRLETVANQLDQLGNDLVNAAESIAKKGLTPETLAKLRDVINNVKSAAQNLINASTMTTPQEMLENAAAIGKDIKQMKVDAQDPKKNTSKITKGAANIVHRVKPQIVLAKGYAKHQPEDVKKALEEAAKQLQAATQKMVEKSHDIVANPNSEDLKKKLLDALEKLKKANDALIHTATDAPDEELQNLASKIAQDMERLKDAIDKGDVKSAAAALSDLKDDVRRQVYLARLLAEGIDDPELRNRLIKACMALDNDLLEKLLPALRTAMENPKDKLAMKQLDDLLKVITDNSNLILTLAKEMSPEDAMVQNTKVMNKTADRAKQSVFNGNATETADALRKLKDQLLKHRHLAEQVAERAHDQKQAEELKKAVTDLEELFPKIVLAAKDSLNKPGDTSLQAKVAANVEAFQKLSTQTGQWAASIKKDRLAWEESERLRRLKEEEELKHKDEVYQAGYQVEKRVNEIKFDIGEEGTPAQMLAKAATEIAKAMKLLSDIAKTGTKKDLIINARQIANFVAEVSKWANKCADECRDPILVQELRDAAKVATNYSVQLKIICAVKAGSPAEDPTAKKSLILSAQGLAKSVIECVNISQIAKLKKKLR